MIRGCIASARDRDPLLLAAGELVGIGRQLVQQRRRPLPRLGGGQSPPGLAGAHLLRHRAPPIAPTTEQKIRGGDSFADWVLIATGYDAAMVESLAQGGLSEAALFAMGAAHGATHGFFQLSYSATPMDVA